MFGSPLPKPPGHEYLTDVIIFSETFEDLFTVGLIDVNNNNITQSRQNRSLEYWHVVVPKSFKGKHSDYYMGGIPKAFLAQQGLHIVQVSKKFVWARSERPDIKLPNVMKVRFC